MNKQIGLVECRVKLRPIDKTHFRQGVLLGVITFFSIWVCLLCINQADAKNVYRWQDEQGVWHFADIPPANIAIEKIEVKNIETIEWKKVKIITKKNSHSKKGNKQHRQNKLDKPKQQECDKKRQELTKIEEIRKNGYAAESHQQWAKKRVKLKQYLFLNCS